MSGQKRWYETKQEAILNETHRRRHRIGWIVNALVTVLLAPDWSLRHCGNSGFFRFLVSAVALLSYCMRD